LAAGYEARNYCLANERCAIYEIFIGGKQIKEKI